MLVQDVMSTDIVTCDVEASLQTAAERMLAAGVGSVIVTREGNPYGILTETDALHAGAVTDRPFTEITVEKAASHPLVTGSKGDTVRKAIDTLGQHGIKKLPIVEEFEVVGILTQSDIRAHFHTFVREAHDLEQRQSSWTTDDPPDEE